MNTVASVLIGSGLGQIIFGAIVNDIFSVRYGLSILAVGCAIGCYLIFKD